MVYSPRAAGGRGGARGRGPTARARARVFAEVGP
jgi:hypothetical protein